MSPEASLRAQAERTLPWIILRPVLPLWYLGIGWSWWRVYRAEMTAAAPPPGASLPPAGIVLGIALSGKVAGWLVETATYALAWRAWGGRLPYWRLFAVVVSASMTDLLGHVLGAGVPSEGGSWWRPALAGLQLAQGTPFADAPAVRAAFGSLGALTLVRIAVTAAAQARALGARWAAPLAVTGAIWLLSRAVVFFGVDLVRGMSPLGGP